MQCIHNLQYKLVNNLFIFKFHYFSTFKIQILFTVTDFFVADLKLLEKDIVRCRSMLSAKKSNDKSKPDCFLKLVVMKFPGIFYVLLLLIYNLYCCLI